MQIILVAEDDALIALNVEHALTQAGYKLLGPVDSGHAALLLVEHCRPDLALLNINLTDGKTAGIALARELRTGWGVPSLYISGNSDVVRRNRDTALGFINKPYSTETLIASVAVVQRLLTGQPTGPLPYGLELFGGN